MKLNELLADKNKGDTVHVLVGTAHGMIRTIYNGTVDHIMGLEGLEDMNVFDSAENDRKELVIMVLMQADWDLLNDMEPDVREFADTLIHKNLQHKAYLL